MAFQAKFGPECVSIRLLTNSLASATTPLKWVDCAERWAGVAKNRPGKPGSKTRRLLPTGNRNGYPPSKKAQAERRTILYVDESACSCRDPSYLALPVSEPPWLLLIWRWTPPKRWFHWSLACWSLYRPARMILPNPLGSYESRRCLSPVRGDTASARANSSRSSLRPVHTGAGCFRRRLSGQPIVLGAALRRWHP